MAKDRQRKQKKPEKPKETPMEFIASMANILVIGLFIVTFNFQAFEIPSGSMENTLLIGDHLFVDRTTAAPPARWTAGLVPYRSIERNDIVVFISPIQPGLHVVKRIIGAPGDRLRLEQGVLFRNGMRVEEHYVIDPTTGDPFLDDFPALPPGSFSHIAKDWNLTMPEHVRDGELVVPPGRFFAMGDHRRVSLDGRYWGFIPRENIIGRPMFIYWSFNTPGDQFQKSAVSERIAWLLHVVWRFIPDTRWSRTGNIVR